MMNGLLVIGITALCFLLSGRTKMWCGYLVNLFPCLKLPITLHCHRTKFKSLIKALNSQPSGPVSLFSIIFCPFFNFQIFFRSWSLFSTPASVSECQADVSLISTLLRNYFLTPKTYSISFPYAPVASFTHCSNILSMLLMHCWRSSFLASHLWGQRRYLYPPSTQNNVWFLRHAK